MHDFVLEIVLQIVDKELKWITYCICMDCIPITVVIRSSGGLSKVEIENMVKAAEQYADEDKKRRVSLLVN